MNKIPLDPTYCLIVLLCKTEKTSWDRETDVDERFSHEKARTGSRTAVSFPAILSGLLSSAHLSESLISAMSAAKS